MPPQVACDTNDDSLVSFEEVLATTDVTTRDGCVMCGIWDGLWLPAFADSAVESIFLDDSETDIDFHRRGEICASEDECSRDYGSGRGSSRSSQLSLLPKKQLSIPPSPRTVCRVWKQKRKQKQKEEQTQLSMDDTERHANTGGPRCSAGDPAYDPAWEDRYLQCQVKQSARAIQRDFENNAPRDTLYSYEKYGTRGKFKRQVAI